MIYKSIIGLIIMINSICSEDACFKRVISDFSLHSNFVVTEISHNQNTFYIVIENSELFHLLHLEYKYDEDEYVEFMVGNKKPILIKNQDILQYKLTEEDIVRNVAEKGESYFLNHYFNGDVLKEEFGSIDLKPIIYYLYTNWFIISHVDDETGYLIKQKCPVK